MTQTTKTDEQLSAEADKCFTEYLSQPQTTFSSTGKLERVDFLIKVAELSSIIWYQKLTCNDERVNKLKDLCIEALILAKDILKGNA